MEVPQQPGLQEQTGVSLTTLWLTPNVGIVKFTQEHEQDEAYETLGLEPPQDKTLELVRYEIKSSGSGSE